MREKVATTVHLNFLSRFFEEQLHSQTAFMQKMNGVPAQLRSTKNDLISARRKEPDIYSARLPTGRDKFAQHRVSAGACLTGKKCPHFIGERAKIDEAYYCFILECKNYDYNSRIIFIWGSDQLLRKFIKQWGATFFGHSAGSEVDVNKATP